ncbi:MAG: DEAD/DEAH box helicase [Sandaracinus sp.]|nr:DEAD/DEAH box helicase [Sandaracinus sp.]
MTPLFPRLSPRLQQAIVARLGWSSLRPVQDLAGAALLDGKNAVVLAPTAGGKTEASMFPTLSGLVDDPPSGVGALYIAPIKALLNNQAERLGLYTEMVGLSRFVWHGDTSDGERRKFLREPSELLMTTPESLEVMLVSQRVDEKKLFGDLRVVVIDEIHALAGSDRGAHLISVLERLAAISKHDVQRVGLSATVGNPDAILTWLQGTSKREGVVVDPPKSPAKRELLIAHRPELDVLAEDAAKLARGKKSLFFCQSRATSEAVAERMRRAGTDVFVHHSAVSREERQLAEERFHHGGTGDRGQGACIVCTSTLELGIDVGDLDRVLQAEAPDTVGSFLQRMGRTGRRAGQSANTTFLCESSDAVLQAIALVELARTGWVESIEVEGRAWPVLVHQLLALSLANEGVTAEEAWRHLSKVPDFRGIHRAEYDRLLRWMLRDRSLVLVSGRLVIGPKAEKRFGRRNFMELYAVFSSPQSYSVVGKNGNPIGTLTQTFVDRLVEGASCFLLGGRAWVVLRVQHQERVLTVEAAPRGKQPTWGGFLPQFLGYELCQRIRGVLAGDEDYAYLDESARAVLAERREGMEDAFARGDIEHGEGSSGPELLWWTFAGGRINSTLRYALEAVGGDWKVIPDNFFVKVRGEHLDEARLRAAIERLSDLELWENEKLWAEIATDLPSYRLSKFQVLMPPWIEREVVASHLLDVAGAWRFLSGSAGSLSRVPEGVRAVSAADLEGAERPIVVEATTSAPARTRPLVWVRSDAELVDAVGELQDAELLGLDVETTLASRTLCLLQIASAERTYLVDALEVSDLSPLGPLLASESLPKIIHNATFERQVLARVELPIGGVIDTLKLSREIRGRDAEGGHGLRAVCARELGLDIDKTEQTSDWTQRPLTASQVDYAARDAEVLLELWKVFEPLVKQLSLV